MSLSDDFASALKTLKEAKQVEVTCYILTDKQVAALKKTGYPVPKHILIDSAKRIKNV